MRPKTKNANDEMNPNLSVINKNSTNPLKTIGMIKPKYLFLDERKYCNANRTINVMIVMHSDIHISKKETAENCLFFYIMLGILH